MNYPSDDMKSYMKQRRLANRLFGIEYLGGACVVCGAKENLEFDHIDRTTKEFTIADMTGHGRKRLIKELDKCQLLCHQHHVEKTMLAGDISESIKGSLNPNWVEALHGTAKMYGKAIFCKCSLCVEWKRNYRNGLVDSRGNKLNCSAN